MNVVLGSKIYYVEWQVDLQGRNGSRTCMKIFDLLAHLVGKVEGMESKMEQIIKELEQSKIGKGPWHACGHKENAHEDKNREVRKKVGERDGDVSKGDGVEVGLGKEGVYEVIGNGCHNSVRSSQRRMYGEAHNVVGDGGGDRHNTPPAGRVAMQMDNTVAIGNIHASHERLANNRTICLDSCLWQDETDDTDETELPATPPELRDHLLLYTGVLRVEA